MTCDQNQIVDHSPDSSALDRAMTDGHIIAFHGQSFTSSTAASVYQQRENQVGPPHSDGSAFKKSLNRFLDDDDVSKEDMMKQAMDKKKAAKANRNK